MEAQGAGRSKGYEEAYFQAFKLHIIYLIDTLRIPRMDAHHESTSSTPGASDDWFYVCLSCGHEDDPDAFGRYCPACGTDLDELENDLQG